MYKLAPLALALAVSTSLHMAVGVKLEKREARPVVEGGVVLAPAMQWVELEAEAEVAEGAAAAAKEEAFVSSPKRKKGKRKEKRAALELLAKEAALFSPEGEGEAEALEQESEGEGEALAQEGEVGEAAESGEAASKAAGGAGGAGGAPSGGQVGGGVDDMALQRHLQASARGCYPLRARRQRLQGTVGLTFCVDAQGMATQARLSQSSGYRSLDEAALECVVKKAQPLPETSRGGCFVAPILFGMQ